MLQARNLTPIFCSGSQHLVSCSVLVKIGVVCTVDRCQAPRPLGILLIPITFGTDSEYCINELPV